MHSACLQTHSVSKGGYTKNDHSFDFNFENFGANSKTPEIDMFSAGVMYWFQQSDIEELMYLPHGCTWVSTAAEE